MKHHQYGINMINNNRNERIWVTHFIQLSVIVGWLSGMFIHVARFSNYSCWLSDAVDWPSIVFLNSGDISWISNSSLGVYS